MRSLLKSSLSKYSAVVRLVRKLDFGGEKMEKNKYEYIVVGMGARGATLAMELAKKR